MPTFMSWTFSVSPAAQTRTFCSHGPAYRDFASNLQFGKPEPTFALSTISRSLNNNVLESQSARNDGDVWADWTHDQSETHLRLSLLGQPGRRYFTARYGKTDSPPIRFFFPEDEGENGASQFVALWQPYQGQPFIERVERMALQGQANKGEFAPVAVRVTLTGGRVDTFLYTGDSAAALQGDGFDFQGAFGYWSEQDGRLRCLHLVGGSQLIRNGQGVSGADAGCRAHVAKVDLETNVITLDRNLPAGDKGPDRCCTCARGNHRSAWRMREAPAPGNVLSLEHNGLLFRSRLTEVAGERTILVAELPPPVEASGGFKPGYYDGLLRHRRGPQGPLPGAARRRPARGPRSPLPRKRLPGLGRRRPAHDDDLRDRSGRRGEHTPVGLRSGQQGAS